MGELAAVTGVELRKIATRPRTWVTVVMLCALPALVAVLIAVSEIAPRPGQGPAFLSAVLADGRLFPAAALGIVVPIFLPVAVATAAGDAVAGEAAGGTLRYLLVRPVGRTRLLVAKLVAVLAFTLFCVVAVAVTALVVGVLLLGHGQQGLATSAVSVSGTAFTPAQVAERTAMVMGYITVSMLAVAALSLFLSTVTDSGLVAALGGLALLVASTVLVALDAAGGLRELLPTRYWLSWVDLFRDPVAWTDVVHGVEIQLGWAAVLLAAAWANFTTRDVTS